MKYFANVKTKQEAKKLFRQLAKIHHPDTETGSNEIMVAIIAEYEKIMKILPSEKSDNNQKPDESDESFNMRVSAEMQEILNNISHLPIDIEIVGTWVWVSGNTFPYKSYLTAYNFSWCPKKKMYSWHLDKSTKYHGKPKAMDDIRDTYGSTRVNNSFRTAIA